MLVGTRAVSVLLATGLGVGLGAGLLGCTNAAEEITERAIEEETGAEVEIDDDGVTITDEDGTEVRVGDAAEVPDSWPDDVPVPTGTVVNATTSGGTSTLLVTVDEGPEATFAALDAGLTGNGWSVVPDAGLVSEFGGWYQKDGRSAVVTVLADGSGGSSVSIAVESAA